MTPLAIASDHGGFALKEALKQALMQWGIAFEDLGPFDPSSCDYPDYAHLMARVIGQGRFPRGVLICGTGVGMSMAANRHPHIRAAVVSDTYSARMAREHNDANVLAVGARTTAVHAILRIVDIFLAAQFAGGRHAERVQKIAECERKYGRC